MDWQLLISFAVVIFAVAGFVPDGRKTFFDGKVVDLNPLAF
ncbi:MAG: hypothetical protein ACLQT6_05475 [Desulfomonilaceae bacterium]